MNVIVSVIYSLNTYLHLHKVDEVFQIVTVFKMKGNIVENILQVLYFLVLVFSYL